VAQSLSNAGPVLPVQRRFGDRNFKYLLVGPSIFVLLLIGLFPLIYLLLVSFQGITMTETDTAFVGLRNYAMLFHDRRLWEALLHTVVFTVIALPLELLLGLALGNCSSIACRAGRCSLRSWCCRSSSRRSYRARPGR